ncbi:TPA: restriction endonuclease subunit S [Citrobacter koseri]|uniref:restriction endonuclease subunit S n=1 Tax=Citrobacter TaxID=544 RepID=UPI000E06F622|nr:MULTISPECIES: restriction endonuclease subunit S [Citrobacter]MCE5352331.1 restriction endonuclease subunit S [Citrobacter koseri]MDM3023603.1 restriction endonuclease subunit S [Citrobacter sp. CK194]STB73094.1 EcoKI restriction-modification system protein HsdS [Citrobacter koseri]STT23275.1 subunit S of type I restriction-modification system [Citrobacter koseri]HCB2600498.1 restriction endonuclease subunit S [Citrobacter koseri]
MSVEKLIVDHIDTWTTALQTRSTAGRGSSGKIDLYGIKKLRELILELAVRGKLVPQDPNDEPASVLLKRIAAEKAELVKQGKIKKQKPLPKISDEEKPFELPEGWEWTRFGNIFKVSSGDALTSNQMNTLGEYPVYGGNGINGYHDSYNVAKRTLVIGRVGYYCGSIHITPNHAWVTDNAFITHFSESNFDLDYVEILLKATNLKEDESATAQPVISGRKIYPIVLAVPPLEEQRKIAKKTYELLGLCTHLEQHSLTSLDAHQQLVETLLTTLTDSQNADELAENWARISEHFDTLFTTKASIDALKQTILQLAVMGKLVPQDPNDEPASELLKRIAQEKAQLVKDGKMKKQKPLLPISDEEKPFELPEGWEWSRLDHVASKITDGDHKTPPRIAEGYKLLSAKNIRDGFLDYENCDYISESSYIKSRERCLPEKGDLLIVSVGGTIGRSSLITGDCEFALVRSVAIIKPLIIESNFLKIAMDSQLLQSMIHSHKRGGAQPCLYLGEISKFLFPVPPLKEQKRIVKTVNIFMGILETLTLAFKSAQQTQFHLADALTDAAIN